MIKKILCFILTMAMVLSLSVNSNQAYADTGYATINITTTDGNGNSIVKEDDYVGISSITITDEEGNTDVTREDQGDKIKVRGNSTALGEKKPFNIKFNSKTSVLGMKKNKKWCLLANCFDPTLLRNYIAFKIGEEMGLMVPDYKIVELTVDGVNKGCYLLTEATENVADIDSDAGEFFVEFEKTRSDSETTYFTSDGLRFAADDPEYEDLEDSSFTYNGQTYKDYIQSTLDNLMNILDSNDYSQVEDNFDVESLAKFYLFNEYYKTVDVGFSSVNFIYRNNKFMAGPMWDYDLTTGNVNPAHTSNAAYTAYFDSKGNSYTLIRSNKQVFAKLLKYDEFNELVYQDYLTYKDVFTKYYEDGGILDETYTQYSTVINRNFNEAGWDAGKVYSELMRIPDATYSENYDFFKEWLGKRNDWLSVYFNDYVEGHDYQAKVKKPTCTKQGYTTYTCSKCGNTYKDNYVAATGHTYDTGKVTTKATNTTAGVKTYTCTVCKKTKTESIDQISSVKLYKGVNKTYKLTSGNTASWKITSGSKYASLKGATLTVKKAGTVKVYDSKSKTTVTVYIKTPTISTDTSVSVKKGKYLQLKSTATPKATVKYYVVSKKYKKYATVTSSGKVKGIKKGTCYIYAKANGVKKKIKVKVK